MSAKDPRVRVVDDDPVIRDAVRDLFHSVEIDAEAFDSAESLMSSDDLSQPGCLIVDVRMPTMSGLELQKVISERAPYLPIIFMTGFGEVETGVEAMKSGAYDFIQKPFNFQKLLDLANGAIEHSIAAQEQWSRIAILRKYFDALSEREQEVARQIAGGSPNKVIAAALNLSEKTVEYHRSNVMRKMEAENAADLIRKLVLLELGDG